MKTFLRVVAVLVFGYLSSADSAFAQNYEYARAITNWQPCFNKGGIVLSYEGERNSIESPRIYAFDNSVGYLYFYIRIDVREDLRPDIWKTQPDAAEIGHAVLWCKVDCEQNSFQILEEYRYSEANELISWNKANNEKYNLTDPPYDNIPFWAMSESSKLMWQRHAELKRYHVETIVDLGRLEVNPFRFEGKIIAVVGQLRRMISRTSAVFFSGYTDLGIYTMVPDQIIVSDMPADSDLFSSRVLLILKGKGVLEASNAFGVKIAVPHLQYIATASGKLPSVFEEQLQRGREDALRNARSAREVNQRSRTTGGEP